MTLANLWRMALCHWRQEEHSNEHGSEAEIRRLSEELRQVSQVVTMGQLTASLAHELNQPLGALLNNARAARCLLASKTPDLTEVDSALDDIIRDDARAVDIVKNVRAMLQRGAARTLPVDVRNFCWTSLAW